MNEKQIDEIKEKLNKTDNQIALASFYKRNEDKYNLQIAYAINRCEQLQKIYSRNGKEKLHCKGCVLWMGDKCIVKEFFKEMGETIKQIKLSEKGGNE